MHMEIEDRFYYIETVEQYLEIIVNGNICSLVRTYDLVCHGLVVLTVEVDTIQQDRF